ncbi:MAG: tripartite tricarboxylate transporter substrate binding protein [Betaproteobacteria bacterium]|nr:tripartite tricarboxylate transporter substrate binding protein [Betaproteobacteria bacterium]
MRFARTLAALAAALVVASPALAQGKFPTRTVSLVVPYPAGGSNDIFARALGKKLSEAWGHPVIVENKPGAGGSIGAAFVSNAAPDGYTIMLLSSSFTTGAAIQPKLPFDPVKGFTPIAMVAKGPMVLTVSNGVPAKTFAEFLALAKSKPGKLNFGSSGQGSTNHFATELLMGAAGIQMTHVPYKGMGPATADAIAGHIDVLVASAPSIMQHVRGGKVRGLGVTSQGPSAVVPELPAISATVPGYAFDLWWGVLAPPGMAKELAASINAEINKALASADLKETLSREGTEPYVMTPAQVAETIRSEIEEWKKVAARANIKVE